MSGLLFWKFILKLALFREKFGPFSLKYFPSPGRVKQQSLGDGVNQCCQMVSTNAILVIFLTEISPPSVS